MWAWPGPAGVGAVTGPFAVVAEGSWDCCVELVTPQGQDVAAAVAVSGEEPVGARPERTEEGVHSVWAEGPEGAAVDLLHPLHLVLHHPLVGQPWYSAAASEGGAGAGAFAGVRLWPAVGPQILGNLGPAGLGGHLVAEGQEVDLQVDPVPLQETASLAVP